VLEDVCAAGAVARLELRPATEIAIEVVLGKEKAP
jgi:hypothetical protein